MFKAQDFEQYMYGEAKLSSFQYVSECLSRRRPIRMMLVHHASYQDRLDYMTQCLQRDQTIRVSWKGFIGVISRRFMKPFVDFLEILTENPGNSIVFTQSL